MNDASDKTAELFELTGAVCNGSNDQQIVTRLEELLTDSELRKEYLHYILLHNDLMLLSDILSPTNQDYSYDLNCMNIYSSFDHHLSNEQKSNGVTSPTLGFLASSTQRVWNTITRPEFLSFLTAVLFLSCLLGGMSLIYLSPEPIAREKNENSKVAAHLISCLDCQWSDPQNGTVIEGAKLYSGQELHLLQGAAVVRFENGAKVILSGDSHFTIVSNSMGKLSSGSLSAFVPTKATGFTVQTPSSDIIDLGTEFGLYVDAQQTSAVSVFSGLVKILYGERDESGNRTLSKFMKAGDRLAFHFSGESDGASKVSKLFEKTNRFWDVADGLLFSDSFSLRGSLVNINEANKNRQEGMLVSSAGVQYLTQGEVKVYPSRSRPSVLQLKNSIIIPNIDLNDSKIQKSRGFSVHFTTNPVVGTSNPDGWLRFHYLMSEPMHQAKLPLKQNNPSIQFNADGTFDHYLDGKLQPRSSSPQFTGDQAGWHRIRIEFQFNDDHTKVFVKAYADRLKNPFFSKTMNYNTASKNFIAWEASGKTPSDIDDIQIMMRALLK